MKFIIKIILSIFVSITCVSCAQVILGGAASGGARREASAREQGAALGVALHRLGACGAGWRCVESSSQVDLLKDCYNYG